MPNGPHRAVGQPIHGADSAHRLGGVAGLVGGSLLAADEITSSPDAMRAAPDLLVRYVQGPVHACGLVTRPLHVAGAAAAAGLAKLHPALAVGVYLPAKLADVSVAAYGMGFDSLRWADSRNLVTRLPYAPYPAWCDAEMPATGCPDPMGYVRSAQLSPYLFGAATVVGAFLLARPAAATLWTLCAPSLALVPPDAAETHLPGWPGRLAVRVVSHAQRAAAMLEERAAEADVERQAAAEEEGRHRPLAAARDLPLAAEAPAAGQAAERVATENTPLLAARARGAT